MRYIFLLSGLVFSMVVISCQSGSKRKDNRVPTDVDGMKVSIHRYEQALFTIDQDKLKSELIRLMPEYPLFLGNTSPDTSSLLRMRNYLNDTLILSLYQESQQVYPSVDSLELSLGDAFARYRKAYPQAKIPAVYTYISGLDYENPVRLVDSIMIIALDMYLGHQSRFYKQLGLPEYRSFGFSKQFLVSDCMKEIAYQIMPVEKRDKNLLEWMVSYGKILYFLDVVLPGSADYQKIAYTPDQVKWCRENEVKIWAFFISQQLLFITDTKEIVNYIPDAPFTKGLPKESPGRIGWWVGWQIVRKYMDKNREVTLQELMQNTDSQQILNLSGYKPSR